MNLNSFILLVQLFQFSYLQLYEKKFEGDECLLQNGESGKCVRLFQCPSAIEIVQNREHPELCSFDRFTAIVCCPFSQILETRLSNNKCLMYQKMELEEEIQVTTPFDSASFISSWHNRDVPEVLLTADLYPDVLVTNLSATTTSTNVDYTDMLGVIDAVRRPLTDENNKETNSTATKDINEKKQENTTAFDLSFPNLNETESFIIDGEEASRQEFPHMATLGYSNGEEIKWGCGGSLVSDKFILTAAHCLYTLEFGPVIWVSLGSNYINLAPKSKPYDEQKIYKVVRRVRHPEYKIPSSYNDIALLELNDTVEFTKSVRPACLHSNHDIDLNTQLQATGWGLTEAGGNPSTVLQKVTLQVYPADECAKVYEDINGSRRLRNGIVEEQQFCAGRREGQQDTCKGDSGGPLQLKIETEDKPMYLIVGITSFGKSCGLIGVPGVYIRVSQYISWIEQIVWPREF